MSCMAGVHEMFVTTDKVQVHEYDKKIIVINHNQVLIVLLIFTSFFVFNVIV